MASQFNLTAQLQLQANDGNINQVVNKVKKQLAPLGNAQIKIQADKKALAAANKQVEKLNKNLNTSKKTVKEFGAGFNESLRRFGVISVITGGLFKFTQAIRTATKEALAFEVELIKISQVTGKTIAELSSLSEEVRKLSTELGVSSASLLNTSRILLQTGLSASKAKQALEILAKTTLAATFDDIQSTTEGAIALINQFGDDARKAGGEIAFLEQSLDAVNAVSKKFAVESSDLISVVRRVGGVFSSAGGNVNELIALFTSVRQTTREGAETIATGLRTIFTRIQRTDTVEALRDLNIELRDSQGKFVGAFEAVKRLSIGLAGLDTKDVKFAEIVEELGGFRQIGKVIPLIKQFTVAQEALAVAQDSSGSVAADAVKAQKSLSNQFQQTKEKFTELIAKIVDSSAFRSTATSVLKIADSLIKLTEAVTPLIPLLTTLFALKAGSFLAGSLASFAGANRGGGGFSSRFAAGGKVRKFASGGSVPGSGNQDTVPAMLTPGEFVIRKSSVNKIGAENLAQMNEGRQKFALGGRADGNPESKPYIYNSKVTRDKANKEVFNKSINRFNPDDNFKVTRAGDKTVDVNQYKADTKNIKKYRDAVRKGDARKRGLAFEGVVADINPNIQLAKAGARIDASGPTGQLYEIKSEKEALTDAKLNKKAIGAALNPLDSITDQKFADKLTNTELNSKKNDITLGKLGVIQDVTDTSIIGKKDQGTQGKLGAGIRKGSKSLAFGGLIQKFAAGGIVQQGAAGAAILDPESASSKSVKVSVDDVKNKFSQFKGLKKGSDPVSKFYKAKNFNIAKSGLNKATSDKFKTALEDGLVAGTNSATSALANDLGTPSAEIDKSQTSNFVKSINTSVFGRLYENVVGSISRGGNFSQPDGDPNRPFDAEGGLPAGLKDNFSGLPDKFIDLKSSVAASSDANLKGKIVDQIKRELVQDGILNSDYPGKKNAEANTAKSKAKTEKEALARAGSGLGFPVKRNSGGGISGEDTVPALLTPGEFVINNKSAKKIGFAKLNAMNKKGEVQGFNKGGAVGVQRFNKGGITGAGLGLATQKVDGFGTFISEFVAIKKAFEKLGIQGESLENIMSEVDAGLEEGGAAAEVFDKSFKKLIKDINASAKAEIGQGGDIKAADQGGLSKEGLGNLVKNDEGVRKKLAAQQEKEIQAIKKNIQATNGNTSASKAMTAAKKVVENSYGVLAKDVEKEIKESKKSKGKKELFPTFKKLNPFSRKKSSATGPKGPDDPDDPKDSGGGGAGPSLTQLATTVTAASIAATQLGGSLGILDEDTVGAASAAGVMGGALLATTDQLTDFASGLPGVGKRATGFLKGFGGGLAVGAAALQFFSSQATATANKAKEQFDKGLKDIAEGGATTAESLKNSANEEIAARTKSAELVSTSAFTAVAAGAATGAAFGAILGPFGSAVGGVIGGLLGFGFSLEEANKAALAPRSAEAEAIDKTIDSLVGLTRAASEAEKAFKEIDELQGLSKEDKVARTGGVIRSLQKETRGKASEAQEQLGKSLSGTGISASQAKGLDEEALAKAFQAPRVSGAKGLTEKEAREKAKSVKLAQQQADLAEEQNARLNQRTRTNLQDAIDVAPVNKSFEELKASGGPVIQALKARKAQIRDTINGERKSLELQLVSNTDAKEAANIQDKLNGLNRKLNSSLADADTFTRNEIEGRKAAADAAKREIAARIAQVKALREQTQSLNAVKQVLKNLQTEAADIDFAASIAAGGTPDISFDVPELNLDAPLSQIESNVNKLVGTSALLPKTQQEAAKKAAQEFKTASGFIKTIETDILDIPKIQAEARKTVDSELKGTGVSQNTAGALSESNLARRFQRDGLSQPAATEKAKKVKDAQSRLEEGSSPTDILKQLGLGKTAKEQDAQLSRIFKGSEQQVEKFKAELKKASEDGITPEETEKILAPLKEAAQKNAEILTTTGQAANAALAKNAAQIKAESEARTRGLEALNNYNKVVSDGAALVAKLEGRSVSRAKLTSSRTAAQSSLDAGQKSRGGLKLDSGNAAQLNTAKKRALIERKLLGAKQVELKNSGASAQQLLQNQKRLAELNNTIKDADKALGAFGDGLGLQISVLEEELSKAGESRKQAFAVLSEFVLGGADTRKNLNQGAEGILSVVQTGTIQDQSEEQRGLTVGLLDKLKDVQIGNTGLTGGQIKQEVVFRDAVRLGFPPDIAKELATSTTVEQQMLDQIKRLVALQEKQAGIDAALSIPAGGFSTGGKVQYRAGGGSIFKPKGTDTVPAMLTPGEFVIKKSAVDKIGAGNLAALNNGGGPIYRAKGGPVGINAENAVTAQAAGGGVAFPTAEQLIRGLTSNIDSLGPGGFLKLLRDSKKVSEAGIKDFQTLIRSGEFESSRVVKGALRKGEIINKVTNTRSVLTDVFDSLSPSGAVIKRGTKSNTLKAAVDSINMTEEAIRDFLGPLLRDQEKQQLTQLLVQAKNAQQNYNSKGGSRTTIATPQIANVDPLYARDAKGNFKNDTPEDKKERAKETGKRKRQDFLERRRTGETSFNRPSEKSQQAIARLQASGLYLAQGGIAEGSADRIPAMLTPGEFVMSPEAVRTHGVGLMKKLNRGQATGFRTGGLVGSGAVAYRQNGSSGAESGGSSSLSIDSSSLQSVLSEFSASFSSSLDNMVAEFSNMSASMTSLASAITGGMVVNHQFSGDMSLAFKLENADTLKTAISDAMTPKIVEVITTEINRRLDTKDFKSQ